MELTFTQEDPKRLSWIVRRGSVRVARVVYQHNPDRPKYKIEFEDGSISEQHSRQAVDSVLYEKLED